jgi:hypothetical protein
MFPIRASSSKTGAVAIALTFTLILSAPVAFAAKAPKAGAKPPAPTNFRVAAKTAYTITVAWDPAPANSGDFSYHLSGAYHVTPAILPKTATSHTFTALAPGNEYWLTIYTKNAAGTVGGQANLGPLRLPNDTTPPWTAPVVSVGEVGATYAYLSWTRAADDGPYHYSYELWLNGALSYRSDFPRDVTSTVLRNLAPATPYAVQIRTYDFGNNPSPLSDPVSFTTPAANPQDTAPPSAPANVNAYGFGDGSTETQVSWTQSTDNFDAQANIRYDIYVNGRLEDWVFGSGGPRIIYSDFGHNLIEVFATDTAGNTSAAGTTTLFF